ncbi:hypothetical protein J3R30DRAFT_2849494 [Lentinula aciculospora]|uniref:Zinc finger C3HC4 RING-type domain-containing protein n=1 Tax=Lentinula aciculospora TaxID=153920 RepID=A0A9W9AA52_9AGAR|nr:hypothetical protein J3R30DRAFT_2849494 [Lentinula aciculospora]
MTSLPDVAAIPDIYSDDIREIVFGFLTSGQAPGQLSNQEKDQIINKLPRLDERALLAEEETAVAMDSPAHPIEELGVTRLAESFQCNHLFCRRDISRWVADGHDSCPTCRRSLLERNATAASTTSPENAYDPIQLDSILQHLQGVGIETLRGPSTSTFPTFLSGLGLGTSHADDRNEYSAMYS